MLIPPPYPRPVSSACAYGRLAIPDLPWVVGAPALVLTKVDSFRGMFTCVRNAGHTSTLTRYLPRVNHSGALIAADINRLENLILTDIASVVAGGPPYAAHPLLPHIAVGIHLWGGRMGRGAFHPRHGGFFACFPLPVYSTIVGLILSHPAGVPLPGGNWPAILVAKAGLKEIGVSFLTKHLSFWTRAGGVSIQLPILDNVVKKTFIDPHRPPHWNDYVPFVNQLSTDRTTLALRPGLGAISITDMERQLFNWANSPASGAWDR